jgi:DNA-binding response OmpR family regulator
MSRKVVIVDDDRETREALQEALEEHGYTVVLAQSGLRLISYLHVDRPDVILLDVMLSWIDGFELCRAIKRNPEFRNIPVCFISGRSSEADVQQGMACGAAAYFVKPLDLEDLIAQVDALAKQGPAPTPSSDSSASSASSD